MSQRFVATKEIIFVCENKHDTFLHRLILLVHQTRLKSTYSIQIVDSSVHLLVPNNHGVFLLKMIIWGVKWGETHHFRKHPFVGCRFCILTYVICRPLGPEASDKVCVNESAVGRFGYGNNTTIPVTSYIMLYNHY